MFNFFSVFLLDLHEILVLNFFYFIFSSMVEMYHNSFIHSTVDGVLVVATLDLIYVVTSSAVLCKSLVGWDIGYIGSTRHCQTNLQTG